MALNKYCIFYHFEFCNLNCYLNLCVTYIQIALSFIYWTCCDFCCHTELA